MKILSYIGHSNYMKNLAHAIEDDIYIIEPNYKWDTIYGEQPKNVHLKANLDDKYDVAMIHNEYQAKEIQKIYKGRIIGVTHGWTPNHGFFGLPDVMVFLCKRNAEGIDHKDKRIIPHGIRKSDIVYEGNIGCILTITNNLYHRSELLPDLYDAVVDGLSREIIGESTGLRYSRIGIIPQEQVYQFIRCFRVLFYTANTDCAMGYTPLEAMAIGMPIVMTDFADWKEYVVNGANGFISNDVEELRTMLISLLRDHDLAMEMGSKGRQLCQEYFNWDLWVERWNKVLEDFR